MRLYRYSVDAMDKLTPIRYFMRIKQARKYANDLGRHCRIFRWERKSQTWIDMEYWR